MLRKQNHDLTRRIVSEFHVGRLGDDLGGFFGRFEENEDRDRLPISELNSCRVVMLGGLWLTGGQLCWSWRLWGSIRSSRLGLVIGSRWGSEMLAAFGSMSWVLALLSVSG